MKKLSLLIALCMLLTIGGVYATWIYSGTQLDTQTEPFVSKMGGLDHEGNSGAYTFSGNSLDFSVEPTSQEEKLTKIEWGTGTIILTFTPKGDIKDDVLTKALAATLTVELASTSAGEYNSTTIYTVNGEHKVVLDADDWTPVDTNSDDIADYYTYTITSNDVKDAISIGSFRLPTEDEYNLFKAAIQNVKFRIRVAPAA